MVHLEDVLGGKFTPVNMKNCGCRNVRKYREIKDGERYTTLDIPLKFGSLDKMKITYSEPKDYLGISGKEMSTPLGKNIIGRSKKKRQVIPLLISV